MNELCAERSKPATETLKKQHTVNDNGIDFYHIRRFKNLFSMKKPHLQR